jgi:hypothetical protein
MPAKFSPLGAFERSNCLAHALIKSRKPLPYFALTDPLEFLIGESTGVLSMVEVEIRSWFGALSGMKSGKMVS